MFKISIRSALRLLSLGLATTVLVGSVVYALFGGAQSSRAVASIAQYIPLNAQGYILIPRLGPFLETASAFMQQSGRLANFDRLASALSSKPESIRDLSDTLSSASRFIIEGSSVLIPSSCFDWKRSEDRLAAGIQNDTGAAFILDRDQEAAWKNEGVLAIGPVDRRRFASYLASAAVTKKYILRFSTSKRSKDQNAIRISGFANGGVRLCGLMPDVKNFSEGAELALAPDQSQVFARLEISPALNVPPAFKISCNLGKSDRTTSCVCEIFAMSGEVARLGLCDSGAIELSSSLKEFNEIQNAAIEENGLSGEHSFVFPVIGNLAIPAKSRIKWSEQTSTFIIGPDRIVGGITAYGSESVKSSIVRNDAFVRFYKRSTAQSASFMGSLRPDILDQLAFNRLISLPLEFFGSATRDAVAIVASVNFEPLDARVLQDISREGQPSSQTEIPVTAGLGNVNLRVQDEKIGQLVRFADQYALDRLVEQKVSLSLDPVAEIRSGFARYLFNKMGFNDEPGQGRSQSFPAQPQQIMLFDDDPNAWAPGVAIAIKFEVAQTPQSFLCREFQRVRQEMERRILLNAAREAKRQIGYVENDVEYRRKLNLYLETALGSQLWKAYSVGYDFDPVNLKLQTRDSSFSGSDQACEAVKRNLSMNGVNWPVYFLTPDVNETSRKYYYLVPQLIEVAVSRRAAFKKRIAEILLERESLRSEIDAARRAGEFIAKKSYLSTRQALLESKDAELSALTRDMDADEVLFKAIISDINRNGQQIVATIDAKRRVLFIASNYTALSRALTSDPKADGQFSGSQAERVRFISSGDSAARWANELFAPSDAPRWRRTQAAGTILPWKRAIVGLGSSRNILNISVSLDNGESAHNGQ